MQPADSWQIRIIFNKKPAEISAGFVFIIGFEIINFYLVIETFAVARTAPCTSTILR